MKQRLRYRRCRGKTNKFFGFIVVDVVAAAVFALFVHSIGPFRLPFGLLSFMYVCHYVRHAINKYSAIALLLLLLFFIHFFSLFFCYWESTIDCMNRSYFDRNIVWHCIDFECVFSSFFIFLVCFCVKIHSQL